MEYNIYCDESCHLLIDESNVMVLGSIWSGKDSVKEINNRIRDIKRRHGISAHVELKWTKISGRKVAVYEDLVNYFFDNNDLNFRAVVIGDKSILRHDNYNQTHDDWYYKMFFVMLKNIFARDNTYNIYLDYKDTNMNNKSMELLNILKSASNKYNYSLSIINRVQPIRSHEVEIMQLVDILTGAIGYINRDFGPDHRHNQGKVDIIKLISKRSKMNLQKSTLYSENKLNLLFWEPRNVE